jgi:signal peptidase I
MHAERKMWILYDREAVSIYKIPSTSMVPTIASGDLILAEKLTLNIRPPYVHVFPFFDSFLTF